MMVEFLLGAAKALVAGVATSGAALAVLLGVDPELAAAVTAVLGPLFVYLVPNLTTGGLQESAESVRP